jgi:acetyl esterase/lipase
MSRLVAFVVIAAAAGGCSDITVERDVAYDDRFEVTELDVYVPTPRDAPRPAVLVIHGGSWREDSDRDGMSEPAARLAEAGYVAFNVEYRGTPGDGAFPGAVQDVLCALAFIRSNAARWNVDPDRIAAYGYSAGGHLASMLGVAADVPSVQPTCAAGATGPVVAVVSGAGPQDLLLFDDAAPLVDFLGGGKREARAVWIEASPITHVRVGAPPFLLIAGDDDWFVDVEHARAMKTALASVGVTSKLLVIPGGGHVFNRSPSGQTWDLVPPLDTPSAWSATIDFLDRTIGGDL